MWLDFSFGNMDWKGMSLYLPQPGQLQKNKLDYIKPPDGKFLPDQLEPLRLLLKAPLKHLHLGFDHGITIPQLLNLLDLIYDGCEVPEKGRIFLNPNR